MMHILRAACDRAPPQRAAAWLPLGENTDIKKLVVTVTLRDPGFQEYSQTL